MSTTTAPAPAPEPTDTGPFTLSATDVSTLASATGVDADVLSHIRGGSYEEVRANAVKLRDLMAASAPTPSDQAGKIDPTKFAEIIRARMNGGA